LTKIGNETSQPPQKPAQLDNNFSDSEKFLVRLRHKITVLEQMKNVTALVAFRQGRSQHFPASLFIR
jgi:hypothetical protein